MAMQILFSGFGGSKAPSSMGKISTLGVLRLRAQALCSRDKSERRSAQDDEFVGVLTKDILSKLALMGRSPSIVLRKSQVCDKTQVVSFATVEITTCEKSSQTRTSFMPMGSEAEAEVSLAWQARLSRIPDGHVRRALI